MWMQKPAGGAWEAVVMMPGGSFTVARTPNVSHKLLVTGLVVQHEQGHLRGAAGLLLDAGPLSLSDVWHENELVVDVTLREDVIGGCNASGCAFALTK